MDTSEIRLEESINELLQGILLCYENNFSIPALILLYAGIDFVASLNRDDPKADVKSADFVQWVERYLLPESELKCSAADLYSARCGWVHTYTSKSRMVRNSKAKEIFYQFGLADYEDHLQNAINDPSAAVVIHFAKLFNAFRDGLDRWRRDFLLEPRHKTRILENSEPLLDRMQLPNSSGGDFP